MFPSDTDTFGNVVLEAMACGLPVVTTNVGGQLDLVAHERTGLLVPPEDAELFGALARYRDDELLRARHGHACLLAARERTWPRQVEELMRHYLAAIGGTINCDAAGHNTHHRAPALVG